jgi:hypothetical protein
MVIDSAGPIHCTPYPDWRLAMFDTLKYTRFLESAGVSREQAEAHVKIIAEIVEGELTTKRDLRELEYRLIIKLSAILGTIMTLTIAITTALTR